MITLVRRNVLSILVLLIGVLVGCTPKSQTLTRPSFSADSAYAFIAHQMAYGPRVPNSQAHLYCAAWLVSELQRHGAVVELQKGVMTDYMGRSQQVMNIIGHIHPNMEQTPLLLCAHYDTRPWCDEEDLYEDRAYNVPGANDGASGVGVLLEVARQLATDSTAPAVDIVFLDCEDMGTPRSFTGVERENTWCLGSQYFAAMNTQPYRFGVLLDMVGAPDAVFPREYYSIRFAENYQEIIWRAAHQLGYSNFFVSDYSYPIVDDHYYLNLAGIPTVDIIHYDAKNGNGFPSWWHTRKDDMSNISLTTLQAVGEVIMAVIK